MSVTSCAEIHTRTGTLSEDAEEYVRTFLVVTDDPNDTPVTAGNAPGIIIGDEYPTVSYCLAKNITVTCTSDDGCQWLVTITYGQLKNEDPENPLNDPYEIGWSLSQFQTPVDYDIWGNPILNSALRPFAEPVMKDDSRPVLTVTRNEAIFNSYLAYMYRDAVNSTGFMGCPAGTVKVSNISAQSQYHQKIGYYYKVTYEFHFNVMGFDSILLDQGFEEYDYNNQIWKKILVQGQPVSNAVCLDGQGKELKQGGQPYYHYYRVYPRLPFGVFNF